MPHFLYSASSLEEYCERQLSVVHFFYYFDGACDSTQKRKKNGYYSKLSKGNIYFTNVIATDRKLQTLLLTTPPIVLAFSHWYARMCAKTVLSVWANVLSFMTKLSICTFLVLAHIFTVSLFSSIFLNSECTKRTFP